MSKIILVTGGQGYIGSHCLIELIKEGYEIVVVDNSANSCKECINRVEKITEKLNYELMFDWIQADPPDIAKIPADDAVGVTVVLITASYREQEFVRVGYYVTNEYEDMELRENPPQEPQFDKLVRAIAANEPRVTKFKINWDSSAAVAAAALAAANAEANSTEGKKNDIL